MKPSHYKFKGLEMPVIFRYFTCIFIFTSIYSTSNSATRTWSGNNANNNWTTNYKWVGNVASDALVFSGSNRTSPVNNCTNGASKL